MSPRARAVAITAWLVAVVAALWVDVDAVAPRLAAQMFATELGALDRLAGVRGDDGAARGQPVSVRLEVTGPPWVQEAARQAVAEDPTYTLGDGPHRLIGEFAIDGRAAAARWSLERRGWALHAPSPTTRRIMPALAMVPLCLGALAYRRWRRAAWIVPAVAATAALLSFAWPWPSGSPPPSVGAQLEASPWLAPIVGFARSMEQTGVALAAGVITLCLVLAWFDHRRSRERGSPAAGVAVVLGAAVWGEAAGRLSVWPWLGTAAGLLAVVGLAVFLHATRSSAPRDGAP